MIDNLEKPFATIFVFSKQEHATMTMKLLTFKTFPREK